MKSSASIHQTGTRLLSQLFFTITLTAGAVATSFTHAETGQAHHPASHHGENHSMLHGGTEHAAMEDHSAHMQMMQKQDGYERSSSHYNLPDVELLGADGQPVNLHRLLADERPVMLNFIYTSCTTVCPILSATLSQASKSLDEDDPRPLMISVSIDPEYDTPERLREYASRYNADENWHFLTGKLETVVELQRAFNAYYGNKTNHKPLSFLRQGPDKPWIRLQGFTTSAELVAEYRALFDHHS